MSELLIRIADINIELYDLAEMYRAELSDPIGKAEAEQREPLVEELDWLMDELRKEVE